MAHSFFDLAQRRGQHILRLRAQLADLRQQVDERDEEIVALRNDVAERDARIDLLDRQIWHHQR